MKNLISSLLIFIFCIGFLSAQNRGDSFMKQAQQQFENKEYIKARYYFLQAFNQYAAAKQYEKAVDAGVNVASLYHRENFYKEAFEQLGKIDQMLFENEDSSANAAKLHYYPAKERLNIYLKLKNSAKSNEWLNRMRASIKQSGTKDLDNDLLYSEANYYYTFGNNTAGDAAINRLIAQYEKQQDFKKADECFKQLINMAGRSKNVQMIRRSYERYNQWTDSVRKIQEKNEIDILKKQIDESNQTINDKDKTITIKNGIIITLIVIICILAGVLVLGGIFLVRQIAIARKAKKNLAIANEHNELKAQFIHNISEQMAPTLDTLDQSLPAVQALRSFSEHIQTLSDLENTLNTHYDSEEVNLTKFGESIANEIKPSLKPGVSLSLNIPKMSAKFNYEAVESVLIHLLKNAAEHTEEGKITLEFKKRGAKTMQFIVTDNGCGIPEEKQELLFKPFSEIKDLTTGDGLGLPICALKAVKLNGSLSIDKEFRNGSKFILEIHS